MSQFLADRLRWAMEQAWIEGNVDAYDAVYATDYVLHRPPLPDINGVEALKEYVQGSRPGYSDIGVDWHEWIIEGDVLAYRYTLWMRHTGQSAALPVPPTGKMLSLQGCIVAHARDDQVYEEFEYSDYLGFLQQMGVVPELG